MKNRHKRIFKNSITAAVAMQNLGLRSGSRSGKTHKSHTRPSSTKLMSKSATTLKDLRKSILDFLFFPKALHGFFIPATCCFKVIARPSERLKHGFDVSKSESSMEPAEPDFGYSAQTQALIDFFESGLCCLGNGFGLKLTL